MHLVDQIGYPLDLKDGLPGLLHADEIVAPVHGGAQSNVCIVQSGKAAGQMVFRHQRKIRAGEDHPVIPQFQHTADCPVHPGTQIAALLRQKPERVMQNEAGSDLLYPGSPAGTDQDPADAPAVPGAVRPAQLGIFAGFGEDLL